jgi:hypothetical protein
MDDCTEARRLPINGENMIERPMVGVGLPDLMMRNSVFGSIQAHGC